MAAVVGVAALPLAVAVVAAGLPLASLREVPVVGVVGLPLPLVVVVAGLLFVAGVVGLAVAVPWCEARFPHVRSHLPR